MNKKGVSSIIGVILMVAITVAIAATVYVYITQTTEKMQEKQVLCGKIKYIPVLEEWKRYGVLQMDDEKFYSIYSINEIDYSFLKFSYINKCNVSLVLYTDHVGDYNIEYKSVQLLDCGCN